ncbi:MAG: hypothetical protein U5K30_06200 [Acidimicrobiales bacterium]|nr:hypothetical protein [Acidimicrobiales bacterium]
MIPNCHRHHFEEAEDECRQCRNAFCGSCLVYTNGAKARPLCIQCALKVSGIRGSKQTRRPWRARRAQAKAEKATARQAKRDEPREQEPAAASSSVELLPPTQPTWVSLNAARWDVGAL